MPAVKRPDWVQGHTLRTKQTLRWSEDQWRANNAHEGARLFANFKQKDEGKSRSLVAVFEDPKAAAFVYALINAAPMAAIEKAADYADKWVP